MSSRSTPSDAREGRAPSLPVDGFWENGKEFENNIHNWSQQTGWTHVRTCPCEQVREHFQPVCWPWLSWLFLIQPDEATFGEEVARLCVRFDFSFSFLSMMLTLSLCHLPLAGTRPWRVRGRLVEPSLPDVRDCRGRAPLRLSLARLRPRRFRTTPCGSRALS